MLNRRAFLRQAGLTTGSLLCSRSLFNELASDDAGQQLTILHTNDVHSRLDPFHMDEAQMQEWAV